MARSFPLFNARCTIAVAALLALAVPPFATHAQESQPAPGAEAAPPPAPATTPAPSRPIVQPLPDDYRAAEAASKAAPPPVRLPDARPTSPRPPQTAKTPPAPQAGVAPQSVPAIPPQAAPEPAPMRNAADAVPAPPVVTKTAPPATTPDAAPATAQTGQAPLPPWAPLFGIGAVVLAALGGVIAFVLWSRRNGHRTNHAAAAPVADTAPPMADPPPSTAEDDVIEAEEIIITAPRRSQQPAATAAPSPVMRRPGTMPRLELSLHATHARLTLMGLTMGYSIDIANIGDGPATQIEVDTWLAHAGPDVEAQLRSVMATDRPEPSHMLANLEPGHSIELPGEIRLAPEQIGALDFAGQQLMIPVIGLVMRHDDGSGVVARSTATFIIGVERNPPQQRMGAFRLDQGPRDYKPLGTRSAGLALMG